MNFLTIGFMLSVGYGLGKILTDILSEVVFSRLHKSKSYRGICKRDDGRGVAGDGGAEVNKKKFPVGFCANRVE